MWCNGHFSGLFSAAAQPRAARKNHPPRSYSGYCATLVSEKYRTITIVFVVKLGVKFNSRGFIWVNS